VKSARKQVKARESLYAAGKNPERALLSALSGFQDFLSQDFRKSGAIAR